MARSLNKVELIGNLTRDPELRYTPQGTPVCSFGLATNRSWTTDSGEKKEEAEFHRIVAWNKLGELCSQLLTKGRKIYVEGRLANRSWTGQDGAQRNITEIIINDMIILDSRREGIAPDASGFGEPKEAAPADDVQDYAGEPVTTLRSDSGQAEDIPPKAEQAEKKTSKKTKEEESSDEVNPDDIPF